MKEGQVALIIGEAGIGKSRLLQRFHEQIIGTPHTWIETGAGAFFQNTPFYPISEMLRQLIGDAPYQLAQLAFRLTAVGLKPAEAIPLLAPLLNLSLPPEYPRLTLPPEQQRRRLLATLVEWVLGAAKAQPLVIATEDLHWVDPSTLELIELLVEQGATTQLLLLYTARPEFRPPWTMHAHHTQITLDRLSMRDVRTIVGEVAGQKALSTETIEAVVKRTGGVPLFVEELTRAVLESGDAKLTGGAIPATLHDSLMARLDRLGSAKEVIQVSAVIGREFSYELLQAVHPLAERNLQRALRSLTDAGLLYVRGIAPDATYRFKHALIRDAAYEALLKSRRKELHLSVAQTIEEKFPILKEMHPEVLARHWTEADEADPAIAEWQRAGERAVERRAYREAEQYYRDALATVETLPESSERDSGELKLQVALGIVMETTRGFAAASTIEVYGRARIPAERGVGGESLQVFNGLWGIATTSGELRAALDLAEQMLAIARDIVSPSALTTAHYAQGFTRHWLGDLAGARQHLRRAIAHYREADFRGNPFDPGVRSHGWTAPVEWQLGHPDTALRCIDDALSLARRQNHPYNLAYDLNLGSAVHVFRGDFERALEASDEMVKLSAEFGFPLWSAIGKIRVAATRARMRLREAGAAAEQIREGLAELDAMKFYLARALFLSVLCETQVRAGAVDDAVVTAELALQTDPNESIYRPYMLQLRGELALRINSESKANIGLAERDFREALRLARGMGARSFELRATTSLARLLSGQGDRDNGRAMLAEIYNWFTEGFDTADLKEAKALLDELSS